MSRGTEFPTGLNLRQHSSIKVFTGRVQRVYLFLYIMLA